MTHSLSGIIIKMLISLKSDSQLMRLQIANHIAN